MGGKSQEKLLRARWSWRSVAGVVAKEGEGTRASSVGVMMEASLVQPLTRNEGFARNRNAKGALCEGLVKEHDASSRVATPGPSIAA